MNTKNIPQPYRARIKRSRRKSASSVARVARARAAGADLPSFGASIAETRAYRKAVMAATRTVQR